MEARIIPFTPHLQRKREAAQPQQDPITAAAQEFAARAYDALLLRTIKDEQASAHPFIGRRIIKHGDKGIIIDISADGYLVARTVRGEVVNFYTLGNGLLFAWANQDAPDANKVSPWEVLRLKAQAELMQQANEREAQARKAREEAAREAFARLRPADAKAVIVADYIQDESDPMTDYFGHTVTRTVVLAWSKHTRNLFPEMRKAARLFPETAHLADAPEDAEHRENYSMGGGYYLKANYRHRSGWRVRKAVIYTGNPLDARAEWQLVTPKTRKGA